MTETRNIDKKYSGWTEDLIKEDIQAASYPFAVAMTQLNNDFNLSSVVRTANALGAREIFYIGRKKWDRRGAVGTHIYSSITHYLTWNEFYAAQCSKYWMVALEQDKEAEDISTYKWHSTSCIILGEENMGLSEAILEAVDAIVEIPQRGSVRSLNAAVASGIAMYSYISQQES